MPKPEASPILFAPDHAGTEAAVAASGLPGWTVLRNHWYYENLLASLPHVLASGHWYSAAGDGRIANIGRDDLAHAAAAALARDFAGKTTLTLSGAKAYTTTEIAALVSEATGKPIQVIPVPLEGLVQGMIGAGLPEPIARTYASFDTNTAAGRVAEVTGDFKALTGHRSVAVRAMAGGQQGGTDAPCGGVAAGTRSIAASASLSGTDER